MATYEQLPGTLGLTFRAGDLVSTEIDFSPLALTGYTMSAALSSLVSGEEVVEVTTVVTNASLGQVNVSLTDEQTAQLEPGTYTWELVGETAGARRTLLTGFVEVTR